jgi:hypothetical protein
MAAFRTFGVLLSVVAPPGASTDRQRRVRFDYGTASLSMVEPTLAGAGFRSTHGQARALQRRDALELASMIGFGLASKSDKRGARRASASASAAAAAAAAAAAVAAGSRKAAGREKAACRGEEGSIKEGPPSSAFAQVVDALYGLMRCEGNGNLCKGEHAKLNRRLHRALVPHASETEVASAADTDWLEAVGRVETPSGWSSPHFMTPAQFSGCCSGLATLWQHTSICPAGATCGADVPASSDSSASPSSPASVRFADEQPRGGGPGDGPRAKDGPVAFLEHMLDAVSHVPTEHQRNAAAAAAAAAADAADAAAAAAAAPAASGAAPTPTGGSLLDAMPCLLAPTLPASAGNEEDEVASAAVAGARVWRREADVLGCLPRLCLRPTTAPETPAEKEGISGGALGRPPLTVGLALAGPVVAVAVMSVDMQVTVAGDVNGVEHTSRGGRSAGDGGDGGGGGGGGTLKKSAASWYISAAVAACAASYARFTTSMASKSVPLSAEWSYNSIAPPPAAAGGMAAGSAGQAETVVRRLASQGSQTQKEKSRRRTRNPIQSAFAAAKGAGAEAAAPPPPETVAE